jgi:hypothetical protein
MGEGWGLCVLEAAALGVPTVAYDVAGLRDAVRDGQTGWLVHDGEELADVVERAVQELQDPERRAQVAAACRAWAAQLTWDRATARMAGLLVACVRRGSSRAARPGAWVVSRADSGSGDNGSDGDKGGDGDNGSDVVAEGPELDVLLESGGIPVRRATPEEHLLGEVSGAARPADVAISR